MSQRRLHAGPRCGVAGCKSTRYYKDDSQTYCQNNHLQVGVLEYQIDEDEALASGFGQRRRRGPDLVERSEKESRTYHGKLGFAAYLQAFQLILRHQAKYITGKLEVPGFESLLKDLWRSFLEAQEADDKLPELEDDEDLNLRQSSDVDDQMDLGTDTDEETTPFPAQSKKYVSARYMMHRPILIHSVALCYITLNLLRVPITMHEIRSWIIAEEFPYIRAVKYLPTELMSRLTPGSYQALEPQTLPKVSRIWRWTQQTALFLNLHSGLRLSELNYRPVLFGMVTDFMLPLETFNATIATLHMTSLDLGVLPRKKSVQNSLPPESRLTCLLLVVAKMFYNLDGTKRAPTSQLEPPARAPDFKAWHRLIKISISKLQGVDLASKVQPRDAFSMTDEGTDEYLDWFTSTWIHDLPAPSKRAITTPQGILDMFPVQRISAPEADKEKLDEVSPDQFKTIEWLYGHPHERLQQSSVRPGQDYQMTSLNKPIHAMLFDDLIELAALHTSTSTQELRKSIVWVEQTLAKCSVQFAAKAS